MSQQKNGKKAALNHAAFTTIVLLSLFLNLYGIYAIHRIEQCDRLLGGHIAQLELSKKKWRIGSKSAHNATGHTWSKSDETNSKLRGYSRKLIRFPIYCLTMLAVDAFYIFYVNKPASHVRNVVCVFLLLICAGISIWAIFRVGYVVML